MENINVENIKKVKHRCSNCNISKYSCEFPKKHGQYKYGIHNECKECSYNNHMNYIVKKHGIEYWEKCMLYNLKDRIRSRTRSAFKRIKQNKPTNTEKLIGCDWLTAKKHIETFFTDKLNWDNFNEWHIDHIIPLCTANNCEEIINLCHYTNLQPLMAKDNLLKGGR
jgi:hypothetical protein